MGPQMYNGLLRSLNPNMVAVGYEKLAVTDSTIAKLTNIPAEAKYCEIGVESATTTGFVANYLNYLNANPPTLPDGTSGIPVSHGTLFDISNADGITNFRVIARTGISVTLHVQYYK